MTQLQILAIAGPLWAAALVGLVVWVGNYRDNLAMKRERSAKKERISSSSEVAPNRTELGNPIYNPDTEAALSAVREAMISPSVLDDPSFAINKISEDIHQKIELMASLVKVKTARS